MKGVGYAGIAIIVVMALSACDREPTAVKASSQPAVERYVFSASSSVAGEYIPSQDVQRLNWRLKALRLGDAALFDGWQAKGRSASAAPAVFVFEDTQSEGLTEEGVPRTLTVVAAAYDISDSTVSIDAVSGGVGEIRFVAQRHDGNLSGLMKIGPDRFENISFQTKTGSR